MPTARRRRIRSNEGQHSADQAGHPTMPLASSRRWPLTSDQMHSVSGGVIPTHPDHGSYAIGRQIRTPLQDILDRALCIGCSQRNKSHFLFARKMLTLWRWARDRCCECIHNPPAKRFDRRRSNVLWISFVSVGRQQTTTGDGGRFLGDRLGFRT